MKQEIVALSQLLHNLRRTYHIGHCANCFVMQEYLKSEFQRLKSKFQALEKLSSNNGFDEDKEFATIESEIGIIGLYLMV